MNVFHPIAAAIRWARRRRDERAARRQWEALPIGERIDIRHALCVIENSRAATPADVELVRRLNQSSEVFRSKVQAAGLTDRLADVLQRFPEPTRRLPDRTLRR